MGRLVCGNLTTPAVCDPQDPACDLSLVNGLLQGSSGRYIAAPSDRPRERLPLFHQLDLRVDKRWQFESWAFSAYLDVQNVYNQQHTEGYAFNFDYTARQPVFGVPILPAFGLRAEL